MYFVCVKEMQSFFGLIFFVKNYLAIELFKLTKLAFYCK